MFTTKFGGRIEGRWWHSLFGAGGATSPPSDLRLVARLCHVDDLREELVLLQHAL